MREIEQQIIDKLTELSERDLRSEIESKKTAELTSLLENLKKEPLGKTTPEFLSNKILKEYLESWKCEFDNNDGVKFRILIENYLTTTDIKLKNEFFSEITAKIIEIKKETFKAHGQGLLSKDITRTLIRNVYLSEDKELIKLFSENLPIPSVEIFEGYPIPLIVQKRTEEATKAVLKFLEGRTLSSTELTVTKLQRKFREKRRQKEERARVSGYKFVTRMKGDEKEKKEFVEQTLRKANTPYKPKGCSPELSDKIFNAAKKIKLFSTVHHLTSEGSLENIFNDSLYGRRTLLQSYLPFSPAALSTCDLEDGGGDANVVCFGPNGIDPEAIQEDSIDMVFDVDKLKTNPCVFYKQLDLGYDPGTVREVRIEEDVILSFSHTKRLTGAETGWTGFQLMRGQHGRAFAYSEQPNYCFIAYNVPDMHQILTLNFFRFLDTLKNQRDDSPDKSTMNRIYAAIEKLDEKGLVEFLTNLGQKMTDTAEFNFYGAYKIDFSAIQTIFSKRLSYTLNLPAFIKNLQSGDKEKLREAREKIPNIFKSYRFLDYLISKVQNEAIQKELLELRQACRAPLWMKEMQKKSESLKLRPSLPPLHSNTNSITSQSYPSISNAPLLTLSKEKSKLSKKTSIPSEVLKESITKEEWNKIASMNWISSSSNPKVKYSSEMSQEDSESFRELLKKAGVDTKDLSITGNYNTKKYQVEFIVDEKQLTELMRLAKDKNNKKPSHSG